MSGVMLLKTGSVLSILSKVRPTILSESSSLDALSVAVMLIVAVPSLLSGISSRKNHTESNSEDISEVS